MGVETFAVALRPFGLGRYPCSSCHAPGAPGRAVGGEGEPTHSDIQPTHPAASGATCTTCHVAAAVDRLVLATGEFATLDQGYRLCAQCHFREATAWAAGAHGKRVATWQDRRVVLNCADCHDPHRPGVERRLPFPGPVLPRNPVAEKPR